jgi:hypothetical protein
MNDSKTQVSEIPTSTRGRFQYNDVIIKIISVE